MAATAGDAYDGLIREQLAEERALKASIEQRGLAVVTTSGVLVSLLFGFAALASRTTRSLLPTSAVGLLIAALALFVGAAICGIITNRPRGYREVDPTFLVGLAGNEQAWESPAGIGTRRTAEVRAKVLVAARAANARKSGFLTLALSLEVAAVLVAGAGVGVILISR